MKSVLVVLGLLLVLPGAAHAQVKVRPKTGFVMSELIAPGSVPHAVDTNVIFLNRCAGGCPITCTRGQTGQTDSVTNKSSVCSGGTRTLTRFEAGDAVWGQVVSCVREVFAPFGVKIVDVDPAPAKHFEIMIAGSPGDIGLSNGVGGISPFSCNSAYIPNSLVFAFSDVYGPDVDEMCATAAQEIAHSFTLDHVIEPSDPLTYVGYAGRRHFKDAGLQCGSDCDGGSGPFGQTCNGPSIANHIYSGPQNHACTCTNTQTQNSVGTIRGLFGDGTPTPPTVSITRPKTGDNVVPGFPVNAVVVDDIAVAKAELRIKGTLVATADAFPYVFNAPATLGNGTHKVEVKGYDIFGTSAVAKVDVVIGAPCTKPADCSLDTDTCVGGRCVPGAGVQGGLGTACTTNEACSSGICVAGGEAGQVCVETCDPTQAQCPGGFDCIETGASGVCYPGTGDGGGCLSASSESSRGPLGALVFGFGFAAFVLVRRRRTW